MKRPNKSQEQAIVHLTGPAQIIAGPGSGKTFTIIQHILYLIQHYHIDPHQILVITYTNAAAKEMKQRYETAMPTVKGVCFGTFHGICYQILRRSGGSCTLIREQDKRKLFQTILGNLGKGEKCTYDRITDLEILVSRMKNVPEEICREQAAFSREELLKIRAEYDHYLREQELLDFDDMIVECLKLLKSSAPVLERYRQMFSYVLTDEFQDVNSLQYEILKLLTLPAGNLFVVGDDDQAIYGFRGAAPGIMRQFTEDFKEAEQIWLTDNYRSGSAIVNLAGRVISRNRNRFEKEFCPTKEGGKITVSCFDTRMEEERMLVSCLSSFSRNEKLETAIILRTNREVMQYTELLRKEGIEVKGKCNNKGDLFHRFMMEDITAFLGYLYEGKKRKDFIGFMNKPNRFLTRSALFSEKVKLEELERYYGKNPSMLAQIRQLFRQLEIAGGLSPFLAVAFFRKTMKYDAYLREKAENERQYQVLMRQCDELQGCFKNYHGGGSVRNFLELWISGRGKDISQDQEGVSVITMHGAKGLEFDRVFLPDVNEGIIPEKSCLTENALEEERRLLYVAITRAKNELYIYYTKERGRKLSSFLEGLIPPHL